MVLLLAMLPVTAMADEQSYRECLSMGVDPGNCQMIEGSSNFNAETQRQLNTVDQLYNCRTQSACARLKAQVDRDRANNEALSNMYGGMAADQAIRNGVAESNQQMEQQKWDSHLRQFRDGYHNDAQSDRAYGNYQRAYQEEQKALEYQRRLDNGE